VRRGDMGIATLIIFIVIILVATVAAVIIIQVTGTLKHQAQGTAEESQSSLARKLVPDTVYIHVDQNKMSGTYKKAIAVWIRARVPEYGTVVDLRKTQLIVQDSRGVTTATYIDADGDKIFGDNACDTTSPYPTNDPTNPGDVEYNALDGTKYTVVWQYCDGKNEDYLVYPGQVILIVYKPKYGWDEEEEVDFTIDVTNGAKYTFNLIMPTFTNRNIIDVPV
jgi:archaellin